MSVEKKKKSNNLHNSSFEKKNKDVIKNKSPLDGVEFMAFNDNKSIIVARQQLLAYFTSHYGLQGDFISTGELRAGPESATDQINAMNIPEDEKAALAKKYLLKYIELCQEWDTNYVKIFGCLLQVMDREGRDRVETHPDFPDISRNKTNPLALWNLMIKVYNAGRGYHATENEIELKTRAKLNYDRSYQGEHTSLLDFKRILENQRQNLVVSQCSYQPTDQDFAADFLEKVYKPKYGAAVAHIKNAAVLDSSVFPKTIDAAYQMLESIVSRDVKYNKNNATNMKNTAFAAKTKGKHSKVTKEEAKESDDKPTTTSKDDLTKKYPCHYCGKLGHWSPNCPELNKAHFASTAFVASHTYRIAALTNRLKESDMIWDTGATQHIYGHAEECILVRPVNEKVYGFAGDSIVKSTGIMPLFGKCLIVPEFKFALISSSRVESLFKVTYKQLDSYVVDIGDGRNVKFIYQPTIGLYVCAHKDFLDVCNGYTGANDMCNDNTKINQSFNAISTIDSNKTGYTSAELKRIEQVKDLIRIFGYNSLGEILEVIRHGVIHDCPLTTTDVMNWSRVYGNDANHLKGTLTDAGAAGNLRMEPVITVKTAQVLHIDLFYFDGIVELISVSKPLNLVMATHLSTRTMSDIKSALEQHITAYNSRGFDVSEINGDNEFAALDNCAINGAILHASGASNPIAERNGGIIKSRVRSVLSSLPWNLPLSLMPELVAYVVGMMNWVPRTGGIGECARSVFEGRKLKMKEIALSFGEYCQVYDKNIVRTNDVTKPRTIGCIAIRSLFNGYGSYKFFNLSTKRFIVSNQWIKLPAPEEVCAAMNTMASDDKIIRANDARARRAAARDNVNAQAVNADPANGNIVPPAVIAIDEPAAIVDVDAAADVIDNVPIEEGHIEDSSTNDEIIVDPEPRRVVEIVEDVPVGTIDDDTSDQVYDENVVNYCFSQMSVGEAMAFNREATTAGMIKEIKQIVDKKIIKFKKKSSLTAEELRKVIPTHMTMKPKYPDGELIMKGRFVANGNRQILSADEEYYSSTVGSTSIMVMLAEAASKRLYMKSIDIEGAYLEAEMTTDVHVRVPRSVAKIIVELYPDLEEYLDDGYLYGKLNKALYGTVQASSLWQSKWTSVLKGLGYEQCAEDDCVYLKMIEGSMMKIATHVDDSLGTHAKKEVLDNELELIGKQFSGYKTSGYDKFVFLGMTIARNANMDVIVTMMDYIKKLCKIHNIEGVSDLPGSRDMFDEDNSALLNEEERAKYHTAVYQCLYLAKKVVRCDILAYASFLSGRVNNPTEKNKEQVLKLMNYLHATSDRGIVYRGGAPFIPIVYGDAAYMVHDDVRSRGGTIIMLCDGPIEAHSSKQTILTRSSTEAELVNLDESATFAMNLRRLLVSMGENPDPIMIYQDNQAVIALVRNGKPKSMRTKHISMRYFTVCNHIKDGYIAIMWISTKQMLADILTKPMNGPAFKLIRDIILPRVDAAYL